MTTPFALHGKRILVTGASSGIGRETALQCARMGASLCLTGRDTGRLNETLSMLGDGDHLSHAADLTVADDRAALVSAIGRLDGVVHCAGLVAQVPFRMLNEAALNRMLDVNLASPVLLTEALLFQRAINPGASIVFISSTAPRNALPGMAAYAGAKSALEAMSRVLAVESARHRVRSNCIAPGLIRTPMLDQLGAEAVMKEAEAYPLGLGEPADVAYACIYLLSDASRWVTGQTLYVEGGLLCR
ncbi:MAG: SDR family oxidoreductase [Rhodospirillaceae bacterium]|nr:SDR family oxidoreductase [Rhodospirillales bacterium]